MNKEVIILANGSFPKKPKLIEKLRNAKMLICCDGAINKLESIKVTPSIIIGDLDSLNDDSKAKHKSIIYHDSDQYTNDLTKAFNWCVDKSLTNITILGATGEREDHTIANIFLLLKYVYKANVKILSDYGTFTPIITSTIFKSFKGQQVSIFSPDYNTLVSTHNLLYPIEKQNLMELWSGSLNESLSDSFEIELFGDGGAIIYQLY